MSERINYGIVGNVSARNLAVGENAHVEVTGGDADLGALLETLLRAIAAFDGDAASQSELDAQGAAVAEALRSPDPGVRERVLARLGLIASIAGPTSAIVTAVTALADTVRAIA
jgi:hypothetical protein